MSICRQDRDAGCLCCLRGIAANISSYRILRLLWGMFQVHSTSIAGISVPACKEEGVKWRRFSSCNQPASPAADCQDEDGRHQCVSVVLRNSSRKSVCGRWLHFKASLRSNFKYLSHCKETIPSHQFQDRDNASLVLSGGCISDLIKLYLLT